VAAIDDSAQVVCRILSAVPVRDLGPVAWHDLEVCRYGTVALAALPVTRGAEALVELLAGVLRQVLGQRRCEPRCHQQNACPSRNARKERDAATPGITPLRGRTTCTRVKIVAQLGGVEGSDAGACSQA